jgi:cytochrome c oxidase subunit 1
MTLEAARPADVGHATPPPPLSVATRRRPAWMGQHVGTALVLMVGGYALGHWAGNLITGSYSAPYFVFQNDAAAFLGLLFGILGWLTGIGALNYPAAKLLGREPTPEDPSEGWIRYFKFTVDHKVVGLQYLVGVLIFLFTGGLLAMGIRTELLSFSGTAGSSPIFNPDAYLQIVSAHGTIMMMMASSLVVGPLGNYLVPLMIGSRKMAFPRVEAASFWAFMTGLVCILASFGFGGFDTGWTGYAPLQTQDKAGIDCYLVGFAIVGTGMVLAGFNIAATIINNRAPGLTWGRLPIFVWSMLATTSLLTLATPVLFVACLFGGLDRVAETAFYVNEHGGSSFLWENLFWFFGHPEVYIMALPGFGIVAELLSTFCRKPVFAYRFSAAGMIGVALLSFFVWQHHLFQSGIDPDMRPLFMLTTELISIPTGLIYLIAMGTLWKAKIRFEVPMLFALAMFFNFLIGGMTGVFLSDVPVDVTLHGSFFVLAHFHYTIMGGLVFAFFGGLYYWIPKMTGHMLNERLAKIHFWMMFVFFNLTFFPLFIVGFLGQPRRVFEYAHNLGTLNDIASVSAYLLATSFLVFVANFVWSVFVDPKPAPANPWGSLGLEWQIASPAPPDNFDRIPIVLNDPYHYGEGHRVPVADLGLVRAGAAPPARASAESPAGASPSDGGTWSDDGGRAGG